MIRTKEAQQRAQEHLKTICAELGEGYAISQEAIFHGGDKALEINESRHSWNLNPTGKLYVTVGSYGNTKRFNERKDHTFRISDLILEVRSRVDRRKSTRAMQNKLDEARKQARDKLEEHGIYRLGHIGKMELCYTTIDTNPAVSFQFKAPLNKVDQLIEVLGEILNDERSKS